MRRQLYWLWHQFLRPNFEQRGRIVIGLYLILTGATHIVRVSTTALHFLTGEEYGEIALFLGLGLLVTLFRDWADGLVGRIFALVTAVFLAIWATDLIVRAQITPMAMVYYDLGSRTSAFWASCLFAAVMFWDAVRP